MKMGTKTVTDSQPFQNSLQFHASFHGISVTCTGTTQVKDLWCRSWLYRCGSSSSLLHFISFISRTTDRASGWLIDTLLASVKPIPLRDKCDLVNLRIEIDQVPSKSQRKKLTDCVRFATRVTTSRLLRLANRPSSSMSPTWVKCCSIDSNKFTIKPILQCSRVVKGVQKSLRADDR